VRPLAQNARAIDDLMERASGALVAADYFEAETIALRALEKARHAGDFERMARICLPIQEARRQRRHEAIDSGQTFLIRTLPSRGEALRAGCYLLEPPLIGIEGRVVRDFAERRRVPVLVLVREPTAQSGRWPIVGVGQGMRQPVSVRVQVMPPPETAGGGRTTPPPVEWFLRTQELLGDAAISKVRPEWAADHRVEDLLELLDAVPDHEKLIQALERACREAAAIPPSALGRRRSIIDDEFSF